MVYVICSELNCEQINILDRFQNVIKSGFDDKKKSGAYVDKKVGILKRQNREYSFLQKKKNIPTGPIKWTRG